MRKVMLARRLSNTPNRCLTLSLLPSRSDYDSAARRWSTVRAGTLQKQAPRRFVFSFAAADITQVPRYAALEHVTTDGERWDNLARRYYGDALAYVTHHRGQSARRYYAGFAPSGVRLIIPGYQRHANDPGATAAWLR